MTSFTWWLHVGGSTFDNTSFRMKDSIVDPVVVSLNMAELLVNHYFLEEYIKWIGTLRDSVYFEDLKDWICTLSKDECDEMASSASSFGLDFGKICQYFCLEIQFKYLQFCMELYGSLLTQDKSLDFYYQNIIAYEQQMNMLFKNIKQHIYKFLMVKLRFLPNYMKDCL